MRPAARALFVLLACAWSIAASVRVTTPHYPLMSGGMQSYAEPGEALLHGLSSQPWRLDPPAHGLPISMLGASLLLHHPPAPLAALDALWLAALVGAVLCAGLMLSGLFTAVTAAILTLAINQPGSWYPQPVMCFWVLLVAALMFRRGREPSLRATWALAAAIGTSLLYRSTLIFLPPIIALYEWGAWHDWSWKRYGRHLTILCAVPYLFQLPWLAVNWSARHSLSTVEAGQQNLIVAQGAFGRVEATDADLEITERLDLKDTAAVYRWSVREILSHPVRYAQAFLRRLRLAFDVHPLFALLLAAAVWRFRRRREFQALGLLASYLLVLHSLMAVMQHYFAPLWPLAALGAAALAFAPELEAAPKPLLGAARGLALFLLSLTLTAWAAASAVALSYALRPRFDIAEQLDRALGEWPSDPWLLRIRAHERLSHGDAAGAKADMMKAGLRAIDR